VALVIGSGALKCVAAFGAMKALQRAAIPIDMVVACSGGAFCGVWVASGGGDADAESRRFARGWRGAFDRRSYRSIFFALFPRLFRLAGRFGLIDDAAVNRAIRDYVGNRQFEDLVIPLHVVATDYTTGEQVVISSGPLFDGIRATISIPMVFPAWKLGNRQLVDGAVSSPLPVDIAIREGADVIIAMGFEESLESNVDSGLGHVLHLKSLMVNHLYRSQYAFYSLSHHAEVLPIIPAFDRPVGLRDLHLVEHLVNLGEQAAEREMSYLTRLLATLETPAP
jgi:NTE family protein